VREQKRAKARKRERAYLEEALDNVIGGCGAIGEEEIMVLQARLLKLGCVVLCVV